MTHPAQPSVGSSPLAHMLLAGAPERILALRLATSSAIGLLIRGTKTTHPLTPPRDVQPGDTAILSTDGGWGHANLLTMRRDGRT